MLSNHVDKLSFSLYFHMNYKIPKMSTNSHFRFPKHSDVWKLSCQCFAKTPAQNVIFTVTCREKEETLLTEEQFIINPSFLLLPLSKLRPHEARAYPNCQLSYSLRWSPVWCRAEAYPSCHSIRSIAGQTHSCSPSHPWSLLNHQLW